MIIIESPRIVKIYLTIDNIELKKVFPNYQFFVKIINKNPRVNDLQMCRSPQGHSLICGIIF